MPDPEPLLRRRQARVEAALRQCLKGAAVPATLQAAMHYAVFSGGKRLRPLLAYAAAEAVGGAAAGADVPACAVELIHAYSLIHDDLPAMDDDVLRRGMATCHVAYGEATAILAGDALQALAFELLATSPRLSCGHATRLRMLAELARASGWQGMVAGQALDMAATGSNPDETALGRMHGLKTGALISASVILGALSSNLASPAHLATLRRFAALAGLAFQVRDDIIDVESSTAVSGKQQGKDAARAKATYVSVLGLPGARERLGQLVTRAEAELDGLGTGAESLRELARYVASRQS